MTIDWGALYEELYPGLVRYLHSKVWDADRARELAQEVFVRALGSRPDNPRAWLFTVAANLARDESRLVVRRKRHLALLKTEATFESAPSRPGSHNGSRGPRRGGAPRARFPWRARP